MFLSFKEYLDCMEDTFECLKDKYGEDNAYAAIEFYNSRLPDTLEDKYKIYFDLGKMTFGQFSTIENAYNNKNIDNKTALIMIATLVIRPKKEEIFDNIDEEKEEQHKQSILNEHAKDIIEVLNKFSEKREFFINKQFRGVFYNVDNEDEDENEKDEKKTDTLEYILNTHWYWYQIKDMLANKDITKHAEIEDMQMYRIAPHLAYLQIKGKIELKKMKEEELRQKRLTI